MSSVLTLASPSPQLYSPLFCVPFPLTQSTGGFWIPDCGEVGGLAPLIHLDKFPGQFLLHGHPIVLWYHDNSGLC